MRSTVRSTVLRWGPVVAWMAVIFYFSAQPQPFGPVEEMLYSGLIGRLSHVGEYAVLALLLYRAFAARAFAAPAPWHAAALAFAVAVAYGVTDEIHQAFVPGRECSLLDVGYDAVGAAIGAALAAALGLLITRLGPTHRNP